MKKQITILALTGMVATLSACSLFSAKPDPGPVSEAPTNVVTSETGEIESYVDVKMLVGQWEEMDVLDSRLLTVYEDGTYSLEYRGGGTAYGTISEDYEEHPDGSVSKWYSFYDNNGDEFASFCIEEGETFPYDLYSGQDGAMHFARVMENQGGDVSAEAAEFEGVWSCGRCTITIEPDGYDYNVQVIWASSAWEHSIWTYTCQYDDVSGCLRSSNGVRTESVFDDDGNETTSVAYENGIAKFMIENGSLIWADEEEDAGNGMEFLK